MTYHNIQYQMSDHVGFEVDNVILGQVSQWVLWLSLVCVISLKLHTLIHSSITNPTTGHHYVTHLKMTGLMKISVSYDVTHCH